MQLKWPGRILSYMKRGTVWLYLKLVKTSTSVDQAAYTSVGTLCFHKKSKKNTFNIVSPNDEWLIWKYDTDDIIAETCIYIVRLIHLPEMSTLELTDALWLRNLCFLPYYNDYTLNKTYF